MPAQVALDALEAADHTLVALVQAVGEECPEAAVDVADGERRLKELLEGLRLIVEGTDERYVYSFQVNRRLKAGGESLCAERMDIGEALSTQWLPEVKSVIFTSATVSISDSFDHFNHAIGLDRLPSGTSRALHLDSSYDFDSNMAVVVAGDLPDPRNRDAYISALEKLLVDVHRAMGGSTLTLFTNRRDMEELYDLVEPQLAADGLELNCQQRGSSPKRLRDRFLSEKASSLFALKAFWEGFDASGETLRCVVIPPDAVLEVKQAAGRLIRSSSDTGVLVLADSRLVSKGYGKKFLSSLPVTSYQRIEAAQVGHYLELWRRSHERKR